MNRKQTRETRLFVHQDSGDIVSVASRSQERRLPADYKKVEFTKNEQGVPVMRLRLRGATVDVSENGEREVVLDGKRSAE